MFGSFKTHILIALSAGTLLGCGGGSDTDTINPSAFDILKDKPDELYMETIIKLANDSVGELYLNDDGGNATIYSESQSVARIYVDAEAILEPVEDSIGQTSNGYWYADIVGTTSTGNNIEGTVVFLELDETGEEFVLRSRYTTDGVISFVTSGAEPRNIPVGILDYSGGVWIANPTEGETGEFDLQINFDTNTAQLAGQTDSFKMYDNSIEVGENGVMLSSSARIGYRDSSTYPAKLFGSVAGDNAVGVHGTIMTSENQGTFFVGNFIGLEYSNW